MNNTSPQRPSVYDHYATLGLDIFASDETISAAIRSLRKKEDHRNWQRRRNEDAVQKAVKLAMRHVGCERQEEACETERTKGDVEEREEGQGEYSGLRDGETTGQSKGSQDEGLQVSEGLGGAGAPAYDTASADTTASITTFSNTTSPNTTSTNPPASNPFALLMSAFSAYADNKTSTNPPSTNTPSSNTPSANTPSTNPCPPSPFLPTSTSPPSPPSPPYYTPPSHPTPSHSPPSLTKKKELARNHAQRKYIRKRLEDVGGPNYKHEAEVVIDLKWENMVNPKGEECEICETNVVAKRYGLWVCPEGGLRLCRMCYLEMGRFDG
ncbi:hypothetical protein L13192_04236 [Pyrenophora tritici-repentis]|uniref:Uncharacterized protein n=1 Tax=Pyrenophora tritici-repentis (strain Pt-1C-BFP) TaxID=426418 RepID=B2WK06_PYRTR|nr:uncharacterized protein PTRG_10195 [Pyrenophora tritici-repentis Pt-1C-BFP]EDU43246.1 predicted protein [Pyrenophora tritici-repentis Pt-1C-BFP]KAI1670879.1 hypothetical protein L13192_04236 [Pyrenophora tritici-repentis]KAI1684617.1 hypothetical protein KJE20_04901 [Pyrenophora tritici-repentis]